MPEITWHKDGQTLQEDDTHHIMSGGRLLQITNAQVSHTGRYTCLASNSAGDKSKSFSLNVLGRYSIASNLVESPDCTPNSFFFFLLNISTISFHYLRRTSTCVHLPFFFHLLVHSFIIFGIYTMFVPGPVFYTRDTTMNKIDVK